ncbi:MAG: ATP-dependent DNA helicase RecQ [Wenzhouxiangellaceae bacterium]
MITDPKALLRQHFGFDTFKPGQREVVAHLLAGRSAAAVFPTGGGKSLCYQLPALALPGITLVVSPLIALMKDQIDALAARSIAAQRLDSTLSADDYREVMAKARSGQLRLLYVAPERFNNERFRQVLKSLRVSLFAVDEAHCISEWGHNFRPDYLKLAAFARAANADRVLALTATATPKVLDDICQVFEIDTDCAIRTDFYRSNLTLLLTPAKEPQRDGLLVDRLRQRPRGPTIVYTTLQRTAEQVAACLGQDGFPAQAYHAGMDSEKRTAVQDRFIGSDDGIVVATIAFGMGIDKSNIRYVYHYNLPKSLENYSQEIGRAGRDGQPAICETFACPDDLRVLENFIYGDTPTLEAVTAFIHEIFSLGKQFDISVFELSSAHDLRPLVTRTLLTYLELLGHIEGGTPFYSSYRFQPRLPSKDILARFGGERQQFLASVLRHARKARTWFDIDTHQAAIDLQVSRQRIVAALDYLGEQGMLELKTAGVRHRYTLLRQPEDLDALAAKLHRRTLKREASEISRLRQITALVEQNGCQVAALSAHFGEDCQPCGHCSWCLNGQTPAKLPKSTAPPIDEKAWREALKVRRDHPETLRDPRTMARFLCGVSSPWLSKGKLTGHPLFGALDQVPFAEILERADEK